MQTRSTEEWALIGLRAERSELDRTIRELEAVIAPQQAAGERQPIQAALRVETFTEEPKAQATPAQPQKRRVISKAARAKIAAAQKARWAKIRAERKTKGSSAQTVGSRTGHAHGKRAAK